MGVVASAAPLFAHALAQQRERTSVQAQSLALAKPIIPSEGPFAEGKHSAKASDCRCLGSLEATD